MSKNNPISSLEQFFKPKVKPNIGFQRLLKNEIKTNGIKYVHINMLRINQNEFKNTIRKFYNIRKTKNITEIRVERCKYVDDNDLKSLFQARRHGFCTLRSFKLDLVYNSFQDSRMYELSKALSIGLTNLRALEVVSERMEATDKGFTFLSEALKSQKLPNLQHFKIQTEWLESLSNEGLILLGKALGSRRSNLKSIDIDFYYFRKIIDKAFDGISNALKKNAHTLQSVRLSFLDCEGVTPNAYRILSKGLSNKYLNLQTLDLNLSFQGLKDPVIEDLSKAISLGLAKLKYLKLKFNLCHDLTNTSIQALGKALQNGLPALKSIELKLDGLSQVNEAGFIAFGEAIKQTKSSFSQFKINMAFEDNITSNTMKALSQAIALKHPDLISLKWRFHYCNKIEEIGLNTAHGFSKLECLDLDFSNCTQLKDNSLILLNEGLHKLADSLKYVSYNFDLCSSLTDVSLISIGQALTKLPKLEKTVLSLQNCSRFSENGLVSLCETLKTASYLKLTHFKINPSNQAKIGDRWLITFCETITRSMTALKCLDLRLDRSVVAKEGLQALSSAIITLAPTLEQLKLDFEDSFYLKEFDLIEFFDSLKTETLYLKLFHIGLEDLKLSNKVLKAISNTLDFFSDTLQDISVDMSYNSNITAKGIEYFENSLLNGFPNLQTVGMSFYESKNITSKERNRFAKILLARKPRLKHISFRELNIYNLNFERRF